MFAYGAAVLNSIRTWLVVRFPRGSRSRDMAILKECLLLYSSRSINIPLLWSEDPSKFAFTQCYREVVLTPPSWNVFPVTTPPSKVFSY